MRKHFKTIFLLALISVFMTACGQTETSSVSTEGESFIYEVPTPGTYDSEGTAIVTKVSEINKTITLYDYELGKSYTLNYDGITRFSDKYDTAMVIGQVKRGSVVDVKFLKSSKKLVTLRENEDSFTISDVSGFFLNLQGKVFSYGGETYKITNDTILQSESGKTSLKDLSPVDKITISGIGTNILSIYVNEGHGYLSLSGEKHLVGGFIEIGPKQIEQISEKMFIVVPEGKYDVKISYKGTESVKQVVITSNEETVLDLSDIEIEEIKTGQVLFAVSPAEATVSVDGKVVDASKLLTFEYGKHLLTATCPGYESFTRYFNVGEEKATLSVTLNADSSSSDSKSEEDRTEGYYVYITTPLDVEVYIDNVYIGLAPVRVDKTAGTHTVTLRKTGYETRSVNIEIKNEPEDVKYNFDNLEVNSSSTTSESGEKETTTTSTTSTSAGSETTTSSKESSEETTSTSNSTSTESSAENTSSSTSGEGQN